MIDGLLDASVLGVIIFTLAVTHVTIAAVTIFLHRHQAHRALELHPVISHFFRFWLWLTTGMVTKEWVAIHRKHHAKCETEDDPHSPQILGLRKVLLEGAELYRQEAKNHNTLTRYGKGTPDDWLERRIYTRLSIFGVGLMLLIDLALFGLIGLSVWAVQMLWIPFWAAGVINGVGHYLGYRNFESPDAATNIVPWGLLIGGEELHNNHHAYPGSARLSAHRWEFDIGWFYIRLLERLRLAEVKKVAPAPARIVKRGAALDKETVRAVVSSRLQVLARYGSEVLHRVYRDELRNSDDAARNLLKRVRQCLFREESALDPATRQGLSQVFERSQALKTAYQMRNKLHAVWQSSSPEKAMHALQDWCRQAEATGIESLKEFARRLQGYRMRGAS